MYVNVRELIIATRILKRRIELTPCSLPGHYFLNSFHYLIANSVEEGVFGIRNKEGKEKGGRWFLGVCNVCFRSH